MSAIPAGLVIRFKRWEGNPDLPVPAYASSGAAGFDLRAAAPEGETLVLKPGARAMVPTGFSVAIPDGYEMQVRPRSGLAFKNGVTVVNAPGTVDSDYRGQVCVLLINLGEEDFAIRRGDRIAQGIIAAAPQWPLVEVDDLDATERGAGGFGSTGV
ncbi:MULTISPECIES: dUTP diphosphatase [Caulobacter]|jgi:dUTP pyrophosphatase|uniref:Deoxyuridine 5'-triphosphate nucleotidohydrolase n=1 Tax=Caulobacter vibrioides OR37 TaxID=1292034 RepID=R0D2H2_CAUVI|nr:MULTISPECIES: dUTP diphosphatase [Caulobacter]ENZ82826.1 deoxyuridine 5'-triphosphate nucleotidohydrolase [Caulobacter vibrioides OR37]MBQ1560123.1 dUTP diphosphatase [Caulobacter sp.]